MFVPDNFRGQRFFLHDAASDAAQAAMIAASELPTDEAAQQAMQAYYMQSSETPTAPSPAVIQSLPAGVTPMTAGDTNWGAIVQSLTTAGVSAYQMSNLQDLNTQLIASGRPPLTAAQAAALAPQLNFGVAPQTQNTLLMVAGIGAAALILMSLLKKRR